MTNERAERMMTMLNAFANEKMLESMLDEMQYSICTREEDNDGYEEEE